MADQLVACEAHGTPTRLTCAECASPICPECLVKTSVGMKCQEHAQAITPRSDRKATPLALGALVLVGAAVVILALAVLRQNPSPTGSSPRAESPPPASAGRPGLAQVFVVNADGTAPHTLTNRALALDASPAWSPDGASIAFESTQDAKRAIWIMRSDGMRLRRVTEGPGSDASPAWSPDGRRIAFMSDRDGNQEVYVMAVDGSDLRRLTANTAATDGFPAWSPDGTRIAFVSDRDGQAGIWVMGSDGANASRLIPGPAALARPAWAPDGLSLAFSSDRQGGSLDVFTAGVDGRTITRVVDSPGQDGEPAWSPDGASLAFASDRDGGAEIYVVNRDGSGLKQVTTVPRSFAPAWAPDSTKLAYINDPLPRG